MSGLDHDHPSHGPIVTYDAHGNEAWDFHGWGHPLPAFSTPLLDAARREPSPELRHEWHEDVLRPLEGRLDRSLPVTFMWIRVRPQNVDIREGDILAISRGRTVLEHLLGRSAPPAELVRVIEIDHRGIPIIRRGWGGTVARAWPQGARVTIIAAHVS